MTKLRTIHLYLGCTFAPMVLFFAISGFWQVLGLHKDGHSPSLHNLSSFTPSEVHRRFCATLCLRWPLVSFSQRSSESRSPCTTQTIGKLHSVVSRWVCSFQ